MSRTVEIPDKPLCMLSLPNSGSTWLAETIAAHSRWSRYAGEYFNPVRNELWYPQLSKQFGCELISCYRNIARAGDRWIVDDIREVWKNSGYTFTKEVFSPYKLPAFSQVFRCFVLLRDAADTFPPGRARVWSFYEHAWHALREQGLVGAGWGDRVSQLALAAHAAMTRALTVDAIAQGVPIVQYRDLFREPHEVRATLRYALGECSDELLAAVVGSRRLPVR